MSFEVSFWYLHMKGIFIGIIIFLQCSVLWSQETTGSLTGRVLDSNGEPVPSATLVLKSVDTNEVIAGYSQDNGSYHFLNVSPADYSLEVSFIGYQTYRQELISIRLGLETNHKVILMETGLDLEQVVVKGSKSSSNSDQFLTEQRIQQTPTIFRSVQELQRSNPENNLNSFQGARPRFNNLNIDGVASNDIIGFQEPASGAAGSQANGTPGSLAKTQPIGFGSIKELSTKTTPFDVSIGNFNGANVDIITKSGTNNLKQTVFGFLNNRISSGNQLNGENVEVPKFSDYQLGINSGGPIKKDRLFYFANAEFAKSTTPLINNPGSIESNITLEEANAVRNHLLENYNYDPGAFEDASNIIQSSKVFLRFDFLINERQKLTFRNNFVSSFADNLEWSQSIFNFGNQGFRHNNLTNSAVLELKSNYSNVFNKLNVSYNRVEEGRTFEGRIFPHIQIATSSASRIFAGTYREASVFNTNFNTFQILDKLSIVKNDHSLSAGFQVQFHDLDYGFLSAWNGRWEYSSVENFLNNSPSRVRGVYNVDLENNNFDFVQNNPAASLGVLEGALYVQDKWAATPQLTIQYGARLDAQFLTRDLPVSTLISESADFSQYTNRLENNYQINPRVEFTYDLEAANLTLHAGTGLFSGRLPYLWFAYVDYISGTDYFNIDIRPDGELGLVESLSDLTSLQPGITEVNLLDPDFKYPRDWKTNFGATWNPNSQWNVNFNFSYTDVVQGLLFQSINRNEVFSNFNGADNRIFYDTEGADEKIDQNFTNIFLLTNTDKGFRYNATLNAEWKNKRNYLNAGYSYGLSKDASSTVRSSPAANHEWNQAVFGNDPEISFSNFDLRHKFTFSYANLIPIGNNQLSASLLYNGRAGTPFTFVYQGDLNNDGSSRNDLIFVPADASQIELVEINDGQGGVISPAEQWASLNEFISDNNYLDSRRGQIAERNGARTPWNHSLDMSFKYSFKYLNNNNASIRMDVFNSLNLINSSWGNQFFVPNVVNSSFSLLRFEGLTDNNVPTYSYNIPRGQLPWLIDSVNSRWRIQVGVELEF